MPLTTKNGRLVSHIAAGGMTFGRDFYKAPDFDMLSNNKRMETLAKIIQLYRFVDTARVYGDSERLIRKALEIILLTNVLLSREDIFISTKGCLSLDQEGKIVIGGSKLYLLDDLNNSLQKLDTSYVDLYFLHRLDPNTPLEESLKTLATLKKKGVIRYIGVSDVTCVKTLEKCVKILKKYGETLDVLQNECSMAYLQDKDNGIFDICRQYHIMYMAYSPLCSSLLGTKNEINKLKTLPDTDIRHHVERYQNNHLKHNATIVNQLEEIAKKKGITIQQLSLAYLLKLGKNNGIEIYPIPGTTNFSHAKENHAAININLTNEEWEAINKILRDNSFRGERWPKGLEISARSGKPPQSSHTISKLLKTVGHFKKAGPDKQNLMKNPKNPPPKPPMTLSKL